MISTTVNFTFIPVGPLETVCYLVWDQSTREAVIIDPGSDPERIASAVSANSLLPKAIVNTHGHWDHIGADLELKQRYGVPLYIHRAEKEFLSDPELNGNALFGAPFTPFAADYLVEGGDILSLGGMSLTVYHTPGHTPGGICLRVEDLLFTGDTLFCGTVGRTDLAGGDEGAMESSLKLFRTLPPELKLLPGHGSPCVLGKEFAHNPYLR